EQDVGCTLGVDPVLGAFVVVGEDGHHLALGGERDLGAALVARDPLGDLGELVGGNDEGGFRRVAVDLPLPVLLGDAGVVRDRSTDEDQTGLGEEIGYVRGGGGLGTGHAVGGVSGAGE